jgi:hypothetical protein
MYNSATTPSIEGPTTTVKHSEEMQLQSYVHIILGLCLC